MARSVLSKNILPRILCQKLQGIDLVPKAGFIHRTYEDITREGNVKMMPSGTAESRRYVLKKDGLSYSFHWTIISKDSSMYIHYKNHQESVMCVEGEAEVEVVEPMAKEGTGKTYKIKKGDCYVLDGHEAHYLRGGQNGAHMICVFTPACTGEEKQQADGSFPLLD